jgi:hypothetical protein
VWPDSRALSAASNRFTAFSTNRLTNVLIAPLNPDLRIFGHEAEISSRPPKNQSFTLRP